jgi:hypothetical protein
MGAGRAVCSLAGRSLRIHLHAGRPHRDRYPRDEAEALWEKLGYEDRLLDTAEPFGLW